MQKCSEPGPLQTRITAFLAGRTSAVGQKRSSAALAEQATEFNAAVTVICQQIDDINLDQISALRALATMCTALAARASNASAFAKVESRILAALWYGTFSPSAQQARAAVPFAAPSQRARGVESSAPPLRGTGQPYDFDFIRLCSSSSTSAPPYQVSSSVRTALGLSAIEVPESHQSVAHAQFAEFAAQRRRSATTNVGARSSVQLHSSESGEAAVSELSVPLLGAMLTTLRAGAHVPLALGDRNGDHSFSAYLFGRVSGVLPLLDASATHSILNQLDFRLADVAVEFYLNALACLVHQACSFPLLQRHRVFAVHVAHRVGEVVCHMSISQLQTTWKLCLHTLGAAFVEIRNAADSALLSDMACALLFRVLVVVHCKWSTKHSIDSQCVGDLFSRCHRSGAALDYNLHTACAISNRCDSSVRTRDGDGDDSQSSSLSCALSEHEMHSMRLHMKDVLASAISLWNRTAAPTLLDRMHQVRAVAIRVKILIRFVIFVFYPLFFQRFHLPQALAEVVLAARNAAAQRLLIDVVTTLVFTELLHCPMPTSMQVCACADDAVRMCIEAAIAQWRERSIAPARAADMDVQAMASGNENGNGAVQVDVDDAFDSNRRCSIGGRSDQSRAIFSLRAALLCLAALSSTQTQRVQLLHTVQSEINVAHVDDMQTL